MFISPLNISPLSDAGGLIGIDKIVADYGFLNAWSSENLTIDGTTTTAVDYLGEHDLANPAAANQPTYSASDSNFNNKPSLTFDGTADYLYKSTANWRSADTSGVMISVYRLITGTTLYMLTTADEGTASNFFVSNLLSANKSKWFIKDNDSPFNNNLIGTALVNDTNSKVLSFRSNATTYLQHIDGSSDAITATSGADDGKWLGLVTKRDNISIASLQRSAGAFANIAWCFSGYMPYVSDANIVALHEELKTHYGI